MQRNSIRLASVLPFRAASCLFLLALPMWSGAALARPESNAQTAQLAELQVLDQRVTDIGWRLASRNLEMCPARFAATGLSLHTESQYDSNWRDAARTAFGFRSGAASVLAVAQGSPAWESGVRPNDAIVSVNGLPISPPVDARIPDKGDYALTDRAMKQLETQPIGMPIVLELERAARRFSITIAPIAACASRFEMATSNQLNANANGSVVQVFGRLVISFPDDDDLALVMAHELAHNILGHNQIIRGKRMSTGLAALWTGSGKQLRDFERKADRYGIFLAARAGFKYRHAADFWGRLAATGGLGALVAVTHPTPKNRQKHAQEAVDEVDRLSRAGKPLLPAGTT